MGFDATSLYPSGKYGKNSVQPEIRSGFAFQPHMNDLYVKTFSNHSFNKDDDDSTIVKIINYNPPNLIIQQLPVKEKVKKLDVNRMRNDTF